MSQPDSAGRTPVMAASANGHLGSVRALIEAYGDEGRDDERLADGKIDTPDNEGRTALMHACMFNQVRCR